MTTQQMNSILCYISNNINEIIYPKPHYRANDDPFQMMETVWGLWQRTNIDDKPYEKWVRRGIDEPAMWNDAREFIGEGEEEADDVDDEDEAAFQKTQLAERNERKKEEQQIIHDRKVFFDNLWKKTVELDIKCENVDHLFVITYRYLLHKYPKGVAVNLA